jgi:hypothetical protein
MKSAIVAAAAAAAFLTVPSTAGAATCHVNDVDSFPAVHDAEVSGVSCATARAIGNKIQRGYAKKGKAPTRLKANGMRFRCTYKFVSRGGGQLMRATCRRTARPAQRAVLTLSA